MERFFLRKLAEVDIQFYFSKNSYGFKYFECIKVLQLIAMPRSSKDVLDLVTKLA